MGSGPATHVDNFKPSFRRGDDIPKPGILKKPGDNDVPGADSTPIPKVSFQQKPQATASKQASTQMSLAEGLDNCFCWDVQALEDSD
jgi:hypothetical protein